MKGRLIVVMVLAAGCGRGHDAGVDAGTAGDPGPALLHTAGWAAHKRIPAAPGAVLVLEETLTSFTIAVTGPRRIRRLATGSAPERSWAPSEGLIISDATWHPSGQVSAVLIATDASVWVARLTADLEPLSISQLHDPDIVNDPFMSGTGETDLRANTLFSDDAARAGADGEDLVVAVETVLHSLIAYRLSFSVAWSPRRRTLVEAAGPMTPFLPIGGSFDTFGAMGAWFRPALDVDPDGNAYLAVWANPKRIREHADVFGDQLTPLKNERFGPADSDIVLTKLDRGGNRLWSRVVGTDNEDEPYGIRATRTAVAVVGRARRVAGDDNTFWDAFIAVTSAGGGPIGTRVLQLTNSSILLDVDALAPEGWVVGGSEGWAQNPSGLSVLSFGTKLLVSLPTLDGAPVRLPLPDGPRHNEIRSVAAGAGLVSFAGSEDGPVMHTGDTDLGQIHATGVVGFIRQ